MSTDDKTISLVSVSKFLHSDEGMDSADIFIEAMPLLFSSAGSAARQSKESWNTLFESVFPILELKEMTGTMDDQVATSSIEQTDQNIQDSAHNDIETTVEEDLQIGSTDNLLIFEYKKPNLDTVNYDKYLISIFSKQTLLSSCISKNDATLHCGAAASHREAGPKSQVNKEFRNTFIFSWEQSGVEVTLSDVRRNNQRVVLLVIHANMSSMPKYLVWRKYRSNEVEQFQICKSDEDEYLVDVGVVKARRRAQLLADNVGVNLVPAILY